MIASGRIQDRVVQGKKLEKAIFDKLCESGFNLQEPSNQDDMLKKVDAWLNKDGKKVGVQIKARETGNDLLFEVYDTFFDFKPVSYTHLTLPTKA